MKHMAAYLMLVLGGNENPSADDVTKALASVGVEADDTALNHLISELEGKDLNEVLEAGTALLAKFGSGGGGGGKGGGGGGGDGGGEEETKKEEEAVEEEAPPAVDMVSACILFSSRLFRLDYTNTCHLVAPFSSAEVTAAAIINHNLHNSVLREVICAVLISGIEILEFEIRDLVQM